jgi:hypothetical protein
LHRGGLLEVGACQLWREEREGDGDARDQYDDDDREPDDGIGKLG